LLGHKSYFLLHQAEERLEQYQDKMDKYQGMREELNSHIAALPDIPVVSNNENQIFYKYDFLQIRFAQLPAPTGLAPLPSAGDLFTH
jgi:hypothetical protein